MRRSRLGSPLYIFGRGYVFVRALSGFAAGALLVMLVDSMIPDATEQAGRTTGLVTALGFAVGAGLSFN